jgi:hypothetical protein
VDIDSKLYDLVSWATLDYLIRVANSLQPDEYECVCLATETHQYVVVCKSNSLVCLPMQTFPQERFVA